MEEAKEFLVDETLETGMRYTEHMKQTRKGYCRMCPLWVLGQQDPVSMLRLHTLTVRLGSIAVAAEGLGGVHTVCKERRQGYMGKLINRILLSIKSRVDVAFLFGIEGMYRNFGFTACLPESSIDVWIRRLMQARPDSDWLLEPGDTSDISDIISLFNELHRCRPWTLVRSKSDWNRLANHADWQPGPECLVLSHKGKLRAYAFIKSNDYGSISRSFEALETAADSPEAARQLLLGLGKRCWDRQTETLTMWEPNDGNCGRLARLLGCEAKRRYKEDGGGMASILNRPALLTSLSDELRRRAAYRHTEAVDLKILGQLKSGALIPDDGHLLRLIVGYWSWEDAAAAGVTVPPQYVEAAKSLFPGGETPALALPFSHNLDRY